MSPDSLFLEVDANQGLSATAIDANGGQLTGVSVDFTSVNPAIATTTLSGVVTGHLAGQTTIRASSGTVTTEVPVIVRAHPHLATTQVVVPARPFGAAVSSLGDVYVTQQDADALTRIRLATLAVTGTVTVERDPGDVAFNSAGTTAYVTNFLAGTLGKVDVASGVQSLAVPLGGQAFRLLVSHDNAKIFVTSGNGTLQVRDAGTLGLLSSVDVGPTPNGIASRGDTILYVSSSSTGKIMEVDVRSGALLRTLNVGGVLQDLALSTDGRQLFVADETRGVLALSLSSGLVTGTLATSDLVFGLGLGPDGWLYVTQTGAGKVIVVDPRLLTLAHTILVGGTPRRVAFDPHGTAVVVPNEGGWADIIR